MRSIVRRCLILSSALGSLLLATPAARAQIQCDECDPQNSYCDDSCWYCVGDFPDYCPQDRVRSSTCGAYGGYTSGCLQCAPNFVTQSRTNVGTYGEAQYGVQYIYPSGFRPIYACDHHRVDWVQKHDVNQCNTNSAYWDVAYCDDYVDASKSWQTYSRDCCDGVADAGLPWADPRFTCNHYHSCT